ncbi:MAG: ABC transporter substrate-binding protein [Alphaproteobacteria bacterium]|nr:ABC transporter substrate-binding protein [Alphaproteobacteria bacterium]
MFIRKLTLAAAGAVIGIAGVAATAQADQPIPSLVYRTGAFAPSGIPLANGFADYFNMINLRDGGVNGVKLAVEECDTGYSNDRGVECYDRTKSTGGGATVYNPWSTGITYALIEKATADKIPILSMGYGRTSAANGKVFPYVFNFPATYWSQATSVIQYIADQEGGLDALNGKRFAYIYLDHPYGKEPIPTLDVLAEKFGFTYDKYPVPPASMTEQKSIWLQVRRTRPDYAIMWGWGAMNGTAVREAAAIRFPMDKFIGNWWSGGNDAVVPAGDGSIGYKSASFHGVGTDFGAYEDIKALYEAGGGASADMSEHNNPLWARGVANAAYVVEAIRTAQAEYGDRAITGEEMRWGLENLDLTDARIAEMGLTGYITPVKITCENHEGQNPAILVQQWKGDQWEIISDWVPAMTEVVQPLIAQESEQYARENNITPRECS